MGYKVRDKPGTKKELTYKKCGTEQGLGLGFKGEVQFLLSRK